MVLNWRYIYVCVFMWSRAPRPPSNGLGSPPPFPCGVGSGGWESPSLLLPLWCGGRRKGDPSPPPCGVGSGGWEFPSLPSLWCGVWWGRVRAGKSWWAHGDREASLVRQTIFRGRRFCSETLGCPFKCFGRPWRFLLGSIYNIEQQSPSL